MQQVTIVRSLLVAGMLAQLAFLLAPRFGPEPYRHRERMEAFVAWKQLGTPEAKSKWDVECVALDQHIKWKRTLLVGGLSAIDGILCYALWNRGKNRTLEER